MATTISTMVGEIDAGEMDWGDEDAQIKKCVGPMESSKVDNIRVAVRARPPNQREQMGDGGGICVSIPEPSSQGVVNVDGSAPFAFDVAFPMSCTQLEVFQAIGVDIVQCAYHGYNASLFAYGQTSSGKSFSMMGVNGTPLVGLIPRIARLLFNVIASNKERSSHVEASYMEIYNEKLRDLLIEKSSDDLKVRENKQLGVHVAGLTREDVGSEAEIIAAIDLGTTHRTTAATLYNSESSRSHAVFEITVQSKYIDPVTKADMRSTSRLALIDLAGSERSDKLGSTGTALKEGNNINKSLTVLGRCIRALVEVAKGKKTSVPFRESVLTWYLRDSLSGNARTTMLAACSPVESNIEETLSTLRYASSAKNIKTTAKKNEDPAQAKIRELSSELVLLKKRLEHAEKNGNQGSALSRDKDSSLDSLAIMSDAEKQNLLLELNKQMGMLTDGGFSSTTSKRATMKRRFTNASNKAMPTYPKLSCLNKDELLSHAMQVSIGHEFPFTIGRTMNTNQDDETSSMNKNSFELDGMGIKGRHCIIVNINEEKEGEKYEPDLAISILSADAAVYVNGIALLDGEEIPLNHLDRIVLGPCRLFCIYLTQPLTLEQRMKWCYDEVFSELKSKGKSEECVFLLSQVRRTIGDELESVNAEQIAQANIIAEEMGCNIHFVCEMVVRGRDGINSPHLTVDEFLETNEARLLVACVVNKDIPISQSVSDMRNSAITKKAERLSYINDNQKSTNDSVVEKNKSKRVTRQSLSGSLAPASFVTTTTHLGSHGGRGINDGWDDDDITSKHDDDEKVTTRIIQGTSFAKKEVLFEITKHDFDDILADLKASHASLNKLTGGLSEYDDDELFDKKNSKSNKLHHVFNRLDIDKKGFINFEQLKNGILEFNRDEDPDFIQKVLREENVVQSSSDQIDILLNFDQFETFLIKFLQHQFYKCIEPYVTNRPLLIELGGSMFHGQSIEVENALRKAEIEIAAAKMEAVAAIRIANERAETSIAAALRNISAAYEERDAALSKLKQYESGGVSLGGIMGAAGLSGTPRAGDGTTASFDSSSTTGTISESVGSITDSVADSLLNVSNFSLW